MSADEHVIIDIFKAPQIGRLLRGHSEEMDVSEAVASDHFQLIFKLLHRSDGEH